MTSVWSTAGNESRSKSELGLVSVEQQRQLRNNNGIISTYMSEKDARSNEAENEDQKIADKELKKISSEHLRTAAQIRFIGAVLNAIGTIAKIAVSAGSQQGVNWATAIPELVNGLGNVYSKWLDLQKQEAEVDAVNEELGKLKDDRTTTAGHVKALDANCYM
jgi:hypothetical protein